MKESTKTVKNLEISKRKTKKESDSGIYIHKNENKPLLSKLRNKKTLIVLCLFIALSAAGYLTYNHLVLAWVDNTPITRYTLYKQLEEKYGKDFTEQLISESLIQKEAKAKGVEVTESEIDGEIKKIEDSQGGAEKLKQAMEAQNVTIPQIRNQIKYQLIIDRAFGKDISLTDQEVKDYIEQNKDRMPPMEGMSASESAQMDQQIRESLKKEKVNKTFEDWLREALQSSRVKRLGKGTEINEVK